ncbi:hypothetical protein RRG08_024925 [Elysia crispata]|uniref:Uncharacterized protein n=1 Tax=Elysia crispata TaxID=231223 RepID=A0AAE1DQ30_9GAST|nr:hypothetical protein RRG08_024925 [Elysia crispata]
MNAACQFSTGGSRLREDLGAIVGGMNAACHIWTDLWATFGAMNAACHIWTGELWLYEDPWATFGVMTLHVTFAQVSHASKRHMGHN